jgi:glycogen operon protein
MLLAGYEVLHSQRGNHNGYCQDNALSWINWDKTKQNADILRFAQMMIALRKRHGSIMRRRFLTGKPVEGRDILDIYWHGRQVNQPLWHDPEARLLVFTLAGVQSEEADLHIMLNMGDEKESVELPIIENRTWCLALDTSLPSPKDIVEPDKQKPFTKKYYMVNAKSVVGLENRLR